MHSEANSERNEAGPPDPRDMLTRIAALVLGVLVSIAGMVMVFAFLGLFVPGPNIAQGQANDALGRFGVFFFGTGLGLLLSLFFGERYNATVGGVAFAGTLGATAIFVYLAWPYLFPTPPIPESPAQLRKITFDIACDDTSSGRQRGPLVATLFVPPNEDERVKQDIKKMLINETNFGAQFIDKLDHDYGHLPGFNGRHILKSVAGKDSLLEIPGSVKEFSVVSVSGVLGLPDEDIHARKLFDIKLRPNPEVGYLDVEVTVDLRGNTKDLNDITKDLVCDVFRTN